MTKNIAQFYMYGTIRSTGVGQAYTSLNMT